MKMSQKKIIFDDDDSEEETNIKINESYAQNYNKFRKAEEYQQLKDKYGEDARLSDLSSESEEEYVGPENPAFDKNFLQFLGIKNEELCSDEDHSEVETKGKTNEREIPYTLLDYHNRLMIDNKGHMSDSEEEIAKSFKEHHCKGESKVRPKDFAIESDTEEEGDDLLSSGLFKTKQQDDASKKKKKKKKQKKEVIQKLDQCHLESKDKWLMNFFVNKKYEESSESEEEQVPCLSAVVDEESISEDEKTYKKMEEFEAQYRFRFQEPGGDQLRTHSRHVESSVRVKDNKRIEKRKEREKRKDEEKERKKNEIRQLQAMKKKEILNKIEQIKQISGNVELEAIEGEIETDFDPSAHDAMMANMFSETYYGGEEDEEKPEFPDDDELYGDYDEWYEQETQQPLKAPQEYEEQDEKDGCEPEFEQHHNMTQENGGSALKAKCRKQLEKELKTDQSGRKQKKSCLAYALQREKPLFDPQKETFDKYFQEYYKLDFEDIIAGMPVRFKYRDVVPNSFGLKTTEILNANDDELKSWYPTKQMIQYGRTEEVELEEKKKFTLRSKNMARKRRAFRSLFSETREEALAAEEEKKRKLNAKRKLRRERKRQAAEMEKNSGKEMDPIKTDIRIPEASEEVFTLTSSANISHEKKSATSCKSGHQINTSSSISNHFKQKKNVYNSYNNHEGSKGNTKKRKHTRYEEQKPFKKPKFANKIDRTEYENRESVVQETLGNISVKRLEAYNKSYKKIRSKILYSSKQKK